MPKATLKHKRVKLSKTEQLRKALRAFHSDDHQYIRDLHNQRPDRTAYQRERNLVCNQKAKDSRLTQKDLINWAKLYLNLKVSQPTISRWLLDEANEGPLLTNVKRRVSVKYPELEKNLMGWFDKYQHCVNMTGDLIRRKAERIRDRLGIEENNLALSGGWLDSFKKRHGIGQHRRFGESGDVDMELVESLRPEIRKLLDRYSWSDIYNMDETSLFYQKEVGISVFLTDLFAYTNVSVLMLF